MRRSGWNAAPDVPWMQCGGQGPPLVVKWRVLAGCQSRLAKMGMPASRARRRYSLQTGTTASPSATASEPPGQKSFWTSTITSASAMVASCARRERAPHRGESSASGLRARVEAVELGGAVLAAHAGVRRRLHDAGEQQLLAEVALVEPAVEDRLVDVLQLAEGELGRQELEADGGVFQLAAQPLQRVGEDVRVVESQLGE